MVATVVAGALAGVPVAARVARARAVAVIQVELAAVAMIFPTARAVPAAAVRASLPELADATRVAVPGAAVVDTLVVGGVPELPHAASNGSAASAAAIIANRKVGRRRCIQWTPHAG